VRTSILFYVSGHGFGHATRIAALIEAVCARSDRTVAVRRIFVNSRKNLPASLFRWRWSSAPTRQVCWLR